MQEHSSLHLTDLHFQVLALEVDSDALRDGHWLHANAGLLAYYIEASSAGWLHALPCERPAAQALHLCCSFLQGEQLGRTADAEKTADSKG